MLKDLSDVVVFSSEVQYHHLSTDVRFCRVDLQRTQNNVVKMSDSRKMWKFCCVFFVSDGPKPKRFNESHREWKIFKVVKHARISTRNIIKRDGEEVSE